MAEGSQTRCATSKQASNEVGLPAGLPAGSSEAEQGEKQTVQKQAGRKEAAGGLCKALAGVRQDCTSTGGDPAEEG